MLTGIASRTALGAALHRAAHQLVDRPPVLEDPLALRLVGAAPQRPPSPSLLRRMSAEAAPLRAFLAARSRFAEDRFGEAHLRGVSQCVALGAGLDTFALRCPLPSVRFVEVDHPATQRWKRELLARAGVPVPARVVFAPVDFEREALGDGLDRAGLDRSAPAFFSWLGVAPYLTPEAVRATLALVAGFAPGSEIVFDFAARPAGAPGVRDEGARAALEVRVARLGEPLRSAFDPEALAAEVRSLGFAGAEVVTAAALDARYFAGRSDGLHLRGGQLLAARR